jgi:hypothetical protein
MGTTAADAKIPRGEENEMSDPKPGEQIPGSDYMRCNQKCIVAKRGGGSEKRYCRRDPKDECKPNDPGDEYRCHCKPWRRKHKPADSPWEEVKTDANGNFDLPDPDEFKTECWCVHKKASGHPTAGRPAY